MRRFNVECVARILLEVLLLLPLSFVVLYEKLCRPQERKNMVEFEKDTERKLESCPLCSAPLSNNQDEVYETMLRLRGLKDRKSVV